MVPCGLKGCFGCCCHKRVQSLQLETYILSHSGLILVSRSLLKCSLWEDFSSRFHLVVVWRRW